MGRKTKHKVGDKSNGLEILEIIPSNKTGKHVTVRCLCHYCNDIKTMNSVNLKKRNSCGCQQNNPHVGKQRGPHTMPWQLATGLAAKNDVEFAYKRSAKRRKYQYDLTRDQFDGLISGCCFYCGEKETSIKKGQGKTSGDFLYTGIDRIDNSKGYTYENCVSCCLRCNIMKHTSSKDDFLLRVKKIYKNKIKINQEQP
jgi:hypothetical protein